MATFEFILAESTTVIVPPSTGALVMAYLSFAKIGVTVTLLFGIVNLISFVSQLLVAETVAPDVVTTLTLFNAKPVFGFAVSVTVENGLTDDDDGVTLPFEAEETVTV